MDKLKLDLNDLNILIHDLENQIQKASLEAENNIKPLQTELNQVKEDKRKHASKGDFDFVQNCIRKEIILNLK